MSHNDDDGHVAEDVVSGEPRRGPSKDELRAGFGKMWRLGWITLLWQLSAATLLGFLMGGSQAMKTEWLENMLSAVPIIAVLLSYRTENMHPERRHPFGHHRTATLAFMVAAFALACVGTYLFYDSLLKLIHGERPSIGGFTLFGHTFWHGWLMIGAMFLTGIPPVFLARAKIPIAKLLHDKAFYACAEMDRANWMSNGAGVIGLTLVAFGLWWGDALAALLISLSILRDGWTNVAKSLSDVMDHHPIDLETGRPDAIVTEVHRALHALPFVEQEKTLLREHGRYLYAEIFIQPNEKMGPVTEATRLVREAIMPLDWRLQHIAVEFTDDADASAAVLTREEMDIESA